MRLKRSSSQIVQKRRARPSERPNRLLRMARVLQRKALLTQLPEHHRRLKQLHHLRLQVCVWLDRPQSSRQDRRYTGEWQKWHGRWYQKVIRHGRVEWEEGYKFSTPCIDDCFCIKPQIRVFTSGCNLGHVGKADRNGLALVNGQSCRSGSPGGV
jgi:hypothetical protein